MAFGRGTSNTHAKEVVAVMRLQITACQQPCCEAGARHATRQANMLHFHLLAVVMAGAVLFERGKHCYGILTAAVGLCSA